jgi:hypothetical protein
MKIRWNLSPAVLAHCRGRPLAEKDVQLPVAENFAQNADFKCRFFDMALQCEPAGFGRGMFGMGIGRQNSRKNSPDIHSPDYAAAVHRIAGKSRAALSRRSRTPPRWPNAIFWRWSGSRCDAIEDEDEKNADR